MNSFIVLNSPSSSSSSSSSFNTTTALVTGDSPSSAREKRLERVLGWGRTSQDLRRGSDVEAPFGRLLLLEEEEEEEE